MDRLAEIMARAGAHPSASFFASSDADITAARAVAFDTNVLKTYRANTDTLEGHLAQLHAQGVGVIVPGQALVEYWNRHKTFSAEALSKNEVALTKAFEPLAELGHDYTGILAEIVGHLRVGFDPTSGAREGLSMQQSMGAIEALAEDASFPFVNRHHFHPIGASRAASRYPPGFMDEKAKGAASLGDFYIWADFLQGCLDLLAEDPSVEEGPTQVFFVSNDQKEDWVTGGRVHPLLFAECLEVTTLEVHHMSRSVFDAHMKKLPTA